MHGRRASLRRAAYLAHKRRVTAGDESNSKETIISHIIWRGACVCFGFCGLHIFVRCHCDRWAADLAVREHRSSFEGCLNAGQTNGLWASWHLHAAVSRELFACSPVFALCWRTPRDSTFLARPASGTMHRRPARAPNNLTGRSC